MQTYTTDKGTDGYIQLRVQLRDITDAYTIKAYVMNKGTRDIYIRTISILGYFLSYSSLNILSSLGYRVDLKP
jgi:hypothetical protein